MFLFSQCGQSGDVAGLVTPIRERVTAEGEMWTKETLTLRGGSDIFAEKRNREVV